MRMSISGPALVLVVSLTGCSFLLTSGPSDSGHPPRSYPSCTGTMTWPIVDAVLTALFVTAAVGAVTDDPVTDSANEASPAERATSAALFAAATGISAYLGFSRVSACRTSREQFAAAYPGGTQPYGYPYAQPYGYPQPQPQPQPQQYPQPRPEPRPPPEPLPMPMPMPAASALGTEGDVCASTAECGTGLTCTSNVCTRPPSQR